MTDRQTNLTLRASVDPSEAQRGVKALLNIQSAADNARKALLKINEGAAAASAEFKRLEEVTKLIGRDRAIEELAGQFHELGRSTKDFEGQLIAMRRALREIGASDTEINKATRAFQLLQKQAEQTTRATKKAGGGLTLDRAEGLLGRTGAALSGIGLGEVGGAVSGGADALQLILQGQQALQGLGVAAGTAATAETAAAGGLSAITASLSPMLLILAPIALAVLSVKLALDAMQKSAEQAVKAEQARFAEENRLDDLRKKNREDARSKSSQQIKQEADDLFEDAQATSKRIADLKQRIKETNDAYAALGASFNPAERSRLGAIGQELQKQLEELMKKRNEEFVANQNAVNVLTPLVDKREQEAKAAQDLLKASEDLQAQREKDRAATKLSSDSAKQRLDDLRDEQQALQEARDRLVKSGNNSEEVKKQIEAYNAALKENAREQKNLTDTAIPLIKAREDEAKAMDKANEAFKSYESTLKQAGELGRDIAKMEADREKELKRRAEDDKRLAERRGIERGYLARIEEAKREESIKTVRDKAVQDEQAAEVNHAQTIDKINQDFFDNELKAYRTYIEAEERETDRANLQRLRTLEDAQTDLTALAARGDVAGFVERSNQAKVQLKRQAEDANIAASERQRDFERQTEEAKQARDTQLADLQASYEDERAVRQAEAQQRIADIEAQGQEANSRAAQLEQELNDIREQWREDDLKRQRDLEQESYDERLSLQRQKQDEMLAESQAFLNEWLAQLQRAREGSQSDGTGLNTQQYEATEHAWGLPYAPRDGYMASLHEGERILSRQANYDYTRGGGMRGGDTYQVSVNNTVGDVATMSKLDEYQEQTVAGIQEGIRQAKGRGING